MLFLWLSIILSESHPGQAAKRESKPGLEQRTGKPTQTPAACWGLGLGGGVCVGVVDAVIFAGVAAISISSLLSLLLLLL